MESTRQRKFARLIQQELGEIFARELTGLNGTLLTLAHVQVTADLGLASVYLSAFPDDQTDYLVEYLNEKQPVVRNLLAQRIRHNVKRVPELRFFADELQREARRVDELLGKLAAERREHGDPDPENG